MIKFKFQASIVLCSYFLGGISLGELAELAKVLAKYSELEGKEFEIVGSLLTSRSYEGLRAGIQRALGDIPEDVERALSPFVNIEDEGVFSEMITLLPYLIKSFRRVRR